MMAFATAVGAATGFWFVAAAISFFNPVVDKVYRSEESHPAVRQLPQSPATIGKILLAVLVQCLAWAWVYQTVAPALGGDLTNKALLFGTILTATKILPRDIDRILLTTYPPKRLAIEFVVGVLCAYVVGFTFAWLL
ncbi:MAG: hypothetical protein AAF721_05050 [Myxococcota bacterium]